MKRNDTDNLRGLFNYSKMNILNILSNYKVYVSLEELKYTFDTIKSMLIKDNPDFYDGVFSDLIENSLDHIESYLKVKINDDKIVLNNAFKSDIKDILVNITTMESVFSFFDLRDEEADYDVYDATM